MKFIFFIISIILLLGNPSEAKELLFEKQMATSKTKITTSFVAGTYYLRLDGSVPASIVQPHKSSLEFIKTFGMALKNIPSGKDFTLVLDSPGGYVMNVYQIELMLKSKCSNFIGFQKALGAKPCKITTYVPKGASCSSACVALFMMGSFRKIHHESYFGFHSAFLALNYEAQIQKEENVEYIKGKIYERTPNLVENLYISYGINKDWILKQQAKGVFDTVKITRYYPFQLMASDMVDLIIMDDEDSDVVVADYLAKL